MAGASNQPPAIRRTGRYGYGVVVREATDLLSGFQIPESHRLAFAGRIRRLAIRQKTHSSDPVRVVAENEPLVSLALLPEVAPFPTAQIRCCRGSKALTRLFERMSLLRSAAPNW